MKDIKSIEFKDEILYLIDQRKLPNSYEIFECKTYSDVNFSIKEMIVRGAPAIGAAAAYGVVLAAKEFLKEDREIFFKKMEEALEVLINSRPTAVNLMWAVKRMKKVIEKNKELELIDIYQAL
ncbi:MAG: methylthioribose-phosphate isomerase, partial [Thermoanaerobacter sp.]|nr:methylthioribose-phosphate isomerase [Thermoanaerobacter sp.]